MYRSSALYKSIKLKVDMFSSRPFFFSYVILQLCYFGLFLLLNMLKDNNNKKKKKRVSVCLSNSYKANTQKPQ